MEFPRKKNDGITREELLAVIAEHAGSQVHNFLQDMTTEDLYSYAVALTGPTKLDK